MAMLRVSNGAKPFFIFNLIRGSQAKPKKGVVSTKTESKRCILSLFFRAVKMYKNCHCPKKYNIVFTSIYAMGEKESSEGASF